MILHHRGYVLRLFNMPLPLPLSLTIGKAYAEELPLSNNDFGMWTHINHPLFGEALRYTGTFKIAEIACNEKS